MDQVIVHLQKIRHFTGHPDRFWPAFLQLATRLAKARIGVLLVQGKNAGTWKKLSVWPAKYSQLLSSPELDTIIKQVAEDSATNRCAWDTKRTSGNKDTNILVLGLRLDLDEAETRG